MNATANKEIRSITIRRMIDDSPDTSWLGEYADSPGPDDRTIDRKERGDQERNTYRYFVAANGPNDTGNPESVEQDYQRMESLNRGAWEFIGINAVAEIVVNGVCQTINSGGLWGIESDSGREYLDEVGQEQVNELREQLLALGFDAESIDEVEVETA